MPFLTLLIHEEKNTTVFCAVLYHPDAAMRERIIKSILTEQNKCIQIVLADSRHMGICCAIPEDSRQELQNLLHIFEKTSVFYQDISCIYCVSSAPSRQLFQTLSQKLYWNIALGKSFFSLEECRIKSIGSELFPQFYQKDLRTAILQKNYKFCISHILRYLKSLQQSESSPDQILSCAAQSIFKLENRNNQTPNENADLQYMNTINQLMNSITFKELQDVIESYYSNKTDADSSAENYSSLTAAALSEIHENYAQPITLNSTSEKLGVTPQHLSRVFAKDTQLTFVDYLTNHRMKKAQQLLSCTDEKIQQIAEKTGYSDPKYFCTIFKKVTGVTPKQFRAMH